MASGQLGIGKSRKGGNDSCNQESERSLDAGCAGDFADQNVDTGTENRAKSVKRDQRQRQRATQPGLRWVHVLFPNRHRIDQTGINQTGVDPTGFDLTGFDLTGSDLTGVDLICHYDGTPV